MGCVCLPAILLATLMIAWSALKSGANCIRVEEGSHRAINQKQMLRPRGLAEEARMSQGAKTLLF